MNCRHCGQPLEHVFLDLGTAPPSNAFLSPGDLNRPETHFPLKLFTCSGCRLVQVDEVQRHDALFSSDYVYFSSYSTTWLRHAEAFAELAQARLGLGRSSRVVEIASNDGYLLQYFLARGIPCLGIEPTASTAAAARSIGVPTIERFFGRSLGGELAVSPGPADLIVGNNVYAHVPDINDFTDGLKLALAPEGAISLEFPHLLRLVQEGQFDTVYHEHFSYLSLLTVERIMRRSGLEVWDVETLATHGGSLRVWAQHQAGPRAATVRVHEVRGAESRAGMADQSFYEGFQSRAERAKDGLLGFLLQQKAAGRRVAAYGAAAKGNTLLNFAGVRPDLLPFVVDASPHKQGRFLPGSRIPVVAEGELRRFKPDFVLVLPWNLREEISAQLAYIREWGGRFVVAIPELEVF